MKKIFLVLFVLFIVLLILFVINQFFNKIFIILELIFATQLVLLIFSNLKNFLEILQDKITILVIFYMFLLPFYFYCKIKISIIKRYKYSIILKDGTIISVEELKEEQNKYIGIIKIKKKKNTEEVFEIPKENVLYIYSQQLPSY